MELDSKKLVDEFLVFFQSHFSSIEIDKKTTPEFIAQHEHTFPKYLFYIWGKLGFASFEHGGFWLVNPTEYEDILELCLKDTKFPEHDEFYVIGRSAFGELYTVGKNTRSKLTIDIVNLRIYPTLRDDENNTELALLRSLLSSITMEGTKKQLISLIKMKIYFLIAV
jgi:hypothetical protein